MTTGLQFPKPVGHWLQVDVQGPARFWMDSCTGRDQVALSAWADGWAAYEAPLPSLVARWCAALNPVVVDVGANTGFYSLLALATGATHVHAFEPVREIADVLRANAQMSELTARLDVYEMALGAAQAVLDLHFPDASHGLMETSASLNKAFRTRHAGSRQVPVQRLDAVLPPDVLWRDVSPNAPVLVKIDVETHEPAVLQGAAGWWTTVRPALVCEVLPGCDTQFFENFAQAHDYVHYALGSDGVGFGGVGGLIATERVMPSDTHRDHLFLPRSDAARWLAPLDM
jgi:FkbM family methyltransferase